MKYFAWLSGSIAAFCLIWFVLAPVYKIDPAYEFRSNKSLSSGDPVSGLVNSFDKVSWWLRSYQVAGVTLAILLGINAVLLSKRDLTRR